MTPLALAPVIALIVALPFLIAALRNLRNEVDDMRQSIGQFSEMRLALVRVRSDADVARARAARLRRR